MRPVLFIVGFWTSGVLAAAPAATRPEQALARLGGTVLRHGDYPAALAFHPDGTLLASGGTDGSVRIWNLKVGSEVAKLTVKETTVQALAFRADGKQLAAHFGENKLYLYDATTWKLERTVPLPDPETLAYSPDGKVMASAGTNQKLSLIELATGLDRMEIPTGRAMAWHPRGDAIAYANDVGSILILAIPSGKPLQALPTQMKKPFGQLAFHPDGERILAVEQGEKNTAYLWKTSEPKAEKKFEVDGPVQILPKDRVIGLKGGEVTIWNLNDGQILRQFGKNVGLFAVSADGQQVATACRGYGSSARIRIWNAEKGQPVRIPNDDATEAIVQILPSAQGAIAVYPDRVVNWTLPGSKNDSLESRLAYTAAVQTPRYLILGHAKGVVRQSWPARKDVVSESLTGVTGRVDHIAASSDGTRLAFVNVQDDKAQLILVDANKWTAIRSWPLPTMVLQICLRNDGRRVAVVGRDGMIRVWDTAATGAVPEELWKVRTARSLRAGIAFSPDGTTLAASSIVRVSLFDAEKGTPLSAFDRKWEDGPYTCLNFSPDGRWIAAGTQGSSGNIVVWEIASRTALQRFSGTTGSVVRVAFSPDSTKVFSAGADETVLAWQLLDSPVGDRPQSAELQRAWRSLSQQDALGAEAAVGMLVRAGNDGVTQIRQGLMGIAEAEKKIAGLIAQLGDRDFQVRETATAELRSLGGVARLSLELAAKSAVPEVNQRAEKLLADLQNLDRGVPEGALKGEPLRRVRAAYILGRIATPETKVLLKEFATQTDAAARVAQRLLESMQ